MAPPIRNIGPGEYALIAVLTRIVVETMDYSPAARTSLDSYLPPDLIEDAQRVLADYSARVLPDAPEKLMVFGGVPA